MIEVIHFAIQVTVSLLLALVALKVIWNLLLPYAMIRLSNIQSVATFPLIETFPWLFALMIAWITGLTGWLSPWSIGIGGFMLIAISYIHLFVVLMIAGYARSRCNNPTKPM